MSHNDYRVSQLPNPLPFYAKVFKRRRGFRDGDHIPLTTVSWDAFQFDEKTVNDYAAACGLKIENGRIPVLFPHSYFGPLHLKMLTDENFPLGMLGALHLRNHLIQSQALVLGKTYALKLAFTGERRRPQGLEIDYRTEIRDADRVVWESLTTFLVRKKFKQEDPESDYAQSIKGIESGAIVNTFPVPKNTGKRFGLITKDINPIHMSRLMAKAFGFERDLCHGMWALGKSLGLVKGVDYDRPVRIDVAFKGPLYMERDITIKTDSAHPERLELLSGSNPRPCVVVGVKNLDGESRL